MIPDFLKNKLESSYSEDEVRKIISGYNIKKRKTTIRINYLKSSKEEVLKALDDYKIGYSFVQGISFALVVDTTIDVIRSLKIYEEGKIYVQSLSSQLPPIFVDPKDGENILDMAASPGGKTTEMAMLGGNVSITALEKNKIRFERLKYNVLKQGAKRVTLLQGDGRNLDEYFKFDKILLDAPCSGSGTLNKDTIDRFSLELVNRSVKVQHELLASAISHVMVGGVIVYSTCSILKEENEDVIEEFIKKGLVEVIPLDIKMFNLPCLKTKIEGTLCVCPDIFYEGFFIAKLKRIK